MSEKVKTRFTALDVTAMVNNLKAKLIGLKVTNIYDINNKTYVFKLAKSDQKEFLLMESGIRFHTTKLVTEKNKFPSAFAMKLRKHLKTRRLEDIQQIGVERVVKFTFGTGEDQYHIILELYSGGNLILTDKDYRILQLIRSHKYTDTIKTAKDEIYPFEYAANLKLESFRTDEEFVKGLLAEGQSEGDQEEKPEKPEEETKGKKGGRKAGGAAPTKKAAGKKLKEVLFKMVPCFHQAMIDNLLRENGLNPNGKATEEHTQQLIKIAKDSIKFLLDFQNSNPKGYLSIKAPKADKKPEEKKPEQQEQQITTEKPENQEAKPEEQKAPEESYIEFSPIPIAGAAAVKELPTFDEAVDTFFIKSQPPVVSKQEEKEKLAWKKFENIKEDQERRIKKLQDEQAEFEEKAFLIQQNLQQVDAVISIIGTMVQGGLAWDKILKMVNESKAKRDPFAMMIGKLKLDKDEVSIFLGDPSDPNAEKKEVEVSVKLNAYANAEQYYKLKKRHEVKEAKTLEATNQALKLAEKAAMAEMKKDKQKGQLIITRKPYWFEKFHWFISSENYLIISGRDMQQNEVLVKKYMNKGDIYMHADIHGASSVIIKNPTKTPIPQVTLEEAAVFTICRSKAWDSKIISNAWWVYDDQVSKTAPSGEYLPTGSFMIRGKKNFLHPSRLEMGYTIMFRIDDSCLERHLNDRKIKREDDLEIGESHRKLLEEKLAQARTMSQLSESKVSEISMDKSKSQSKPVNLKPMTSQEANEGEEDGDDDKDDDDEEGDAMFKALGKPKDSDDEEPEDDSDDEKKKNGKSPKEESKKQQQQKGGGGDKGKKTGKGGQQQGDKDQKGKATNPNAPAALPRGKKNKLKKMQEKYGEQDEEEKEIRMKLIGAKEMKATGKDAFSDEDDKKGKGKKGDKKNKKGKDDGKSKGDKSKQGGGDSKAKGAGGKGGASGQQQPKGPMNQRKDAKTGPTIQIVYDPNYQSQRETEILENMIKAESVASTGLSRSVSQIQDLQKPQSTTEQKPQEEQPKKEVETEIKTKKNDSDDDDEGEIPEGKEGGEDDEGLAAEATDVEGQELRKLVGNLHPEDIILFCIPMCAPYISMMNHKYKVKLVPGSLKRGKAIKTVISLFNGQKDCTEMEKKFIKAMTESELASTMIGNVKIGAAGLLKIKEQEKKEKSQKKKEKQK